MNKITKKQLEEENKSLKKKVTALQTALKVLEMEYKQNKNQSIDAISNADTFTSAESLLRVNDVTINGQLGEMLDNTELNEQKFFDSNEKMNSILNAVHAGIVLVDAETHEIVELNPAAAEMIGASEIDIVGKICHKHFCPAEKGNCPILDHGQLVDNSERIVLTENGDKVPVLKTVTRVELDGHKYLLETFVNISEQKKVEQLLRKSEEEYRLLTEHAVSAIAVHEIILDSSDTPIDYKFLNVNAAFESQTGLKVDEVIGRRATEILPGIENTSFIKIYGEVVRTGSPVSFEQFSEPLGKYYSINAYHLGENRFATVFTDITEQKKEEKFRQLQLEFQQIAAETSTALTNVTNEKMFDDVVNKTLQKLGKYFDADRCYLFKFNSDITKMTNTHEWCADGIESQIDRIINQPTDSLPWWKKQINKGKPVLIPDVNELPKDAKAEQNEFRSQKIQSLLCLPTMSSAGTLTGFLGFDSVREKHIWTQEQIIMLQLISDTIGGTLERRNIEESLRKSKNRFDQLAEQSRTITWEVDKNGLYTYISHVVKVVLGYEPEEIIGIKYFYDLHPEKDRASFKNEAFKAFTKKEIFNNLENSAETKDGQLVWLNTNGIPILDDQGTLLGYRGSDTDISGRKQAEMALQAERHRLANIIEGTNVGTWEWNIETGETIFNDRWAEMIGYTLDEISPASIDTWIKYCHPEDLEKSQELLNKHFEGESDYYECEVRMTHKSGAIVWVLDRGRVFKRKADGTPLIMAGTHQDITERKSYDEIIHKSREQFMLAVNGSHDGIWDWYLADNSLYLSPRWKEMLGYKDNELSNEFSTFENLLHPEDKPVVMEYVDTYLKGGVEHYHIEFRMKHKDGSLRWILARGEALRNKDGKPYRMAGSHTDITEKKLAEQRIQESEENFRTFFETLDDMIMVGDPDGRLLYSNHAVSEKLNYSPDELKGMHILDIYPDARRAEAEKIFTAMFNGERDSCPLPLQKKTGEFIPAETRIWFGKWNGQQCIFSISKDLSKEQEALRKFNKLFNNNPALMAVSSMLERQFTDVNEAFLQKLGYERNEIIGKTVEDLNLFEDFEQQRAVSDQLQRTGRISNCELKLRTKNGNILNGLFSGEIIENQSGKVFLTVMTDITEQKKAQYELEQAKLKLEENNRQLLVAIEKATRLAEIAEQANMAKSQFLANMSHEIRTPMNGILGMTNLVLDTKLSKEQRDYLTTVKASSNLLLTIINDILDFSKIEAGKLYLEKIDFNIRQSLAETLRSLTVIAHEKKLELYLDVKSDVPDYLVGDPGRLRQIFINLIGNAIKFTEEGEVGVTVEIDSSIDNDVILLCRVRDTGIGIPKDKQMKILEPFSQADGSTTRKYGGTGLGLSISKRLVEMMGGTLWLESEVGKGSIFNFTLKLEKGTEKLREELNFDITELKDIPVLIVDDNETNRTILERMTYKWEMRPQTVANGIEALAEMMTKVSYNKPYKLILIDALMPEMDGFTLASRITSDPLYGKVSIVMLTSSGIPEKTKKLQDHGISSYLIKPVTEYELSQAMLRAISSEEFEAEGQECTILDEAGVNTHSLLVVEDNTVNLVVADKELSKRGFKIITAENGQKALDLHSEQHDSIDCILMDVQMPVMDGLEATRKIRSFEKEHDIRHVPIIAMTAYAMRGDRERCIEAGMDDYVSKPVNFIELNEKITKILDGDRLHGEDVMQINIKEALERCGNDFDTIAKMAKLLIEHLPVWMEDLQSFIENNSDDDIERTAHTIKGSVSNFTIDKPYELALSLEQAARSGELSEAGKLYDELNDAIKYFVVRLEEEIGQLF